MAKRLYFVHKIWAGYHKEQIIFEGKIEIDDAVINAVDSEWRKVFYSSLTSPQLIAEHIAFNLVVNDARLTQLDGFANLSDDMVNLV